MCNDQLHADYIVKEIYCPAVQTRTARLSVRLSAHAEGSPKSFVRSEPPIVIYWGCRFDLT